MRLIKQAYAKYFPREGKKGILRQIIMLPKYEGKKNILNKDFPEKLKISLRIYSKHNYILDLRCTQQHIVLHNRNTT